MSRAVRTLAGLLAGLALGGTLGAGWRLLDTPSIPEPTPVHQVTEDGPGWDCASMGNGLCGPGPKGGRR